MERKGKKRKPKSKLAVFVRTFLLTIIIFFGVSTVVVLGLNFFSGNNIRENADENNTTNMATNISKTSTTQNSTEKKTGFLSNLLGTGKKEKVYALIAGIDDDGTRTDTMIIACFDPETSDVTLISLPRDSKVTVPPERVQELHAIGGQIPSSGVCKLNEVHHYAYIADKSVAMDYLRAQIKDLLGVEIDFYAKIDYAALTYLVEQIGGVEFDVPVRMYYRDPDQNLTIDLQPGSQLLDGDKAQQLLRYRSYPSGDDLMRMKTQQEFVKAFIAQALTKDSIVKNIPSFVAAAIKYVETDFNMAELPSYIKYLTSFNADKITTYTLPIARTEMIGNKDYVILDEQGCIDLVQDIFFDNVEAIEQSSEDLRIQVLNGTGVAGLAKSAKELLEINGFTVLSIGDYTGVKAERNRIYVSDRGMGGDIQKILKNSDVVYDPSMNSAYDIIVVIGKLGLD